MDLCPVCNGGRMGWRRYVTNSQNWGAADDVDELLGKIDAICGVICRSMPPNDGDAHAQAHVELVFRVILPRWLEAAGFPNQAVLAANPREGLRQLGVTVDPKVSDRILAAMYIQQSMGLKPAEHVKYGDPGYGPASASGAYLDMVEAPLRQIAAACARQIGKDRSATVVRECINAAFEATLLRVS